MPSRTTRRTVLCDSLVAPLAAPAVARGDVAWPTRPVTWIVPFTPGGITDTTSRLIAQYLAAHFGQPVVVENRPGAGGSIGTEAAARAAPDGHTVLYGTQGTMAVNPALYRTLRYEALRDFVPVHGLTATPNLLVAHPQRPYRTVGELVAYARAHPGEVNFGSAGIGTATHLTAELFMSVTGTRMTHVPYQGSARALNDLVAGTVDIMFDYLVSSGPFLRSGQLRGLAVTSGERLPQIPDVPTIAEAGVPDAVAGSWSGVFVPARTPAPIVARLAEGIAAALADPQVRQTLTGTGSTPLDGMHGERFRRFVAEEVERWRGIIERAGLRVN
jgi:tripartite-type tricarboxylate transporter receptor subunit TctC